MLDSTGPMILDVFFFVVFSELNSWLLIQLDTFLELLESNNRKIPKYAKLTSNDGIQFLLHFDMLNRANYCTNAMFHVKHFINELGERIGVKRDSYYRYTIRYTSSKIRHCTFGCHFAIDRRT